MKTRLFLFLALFSFRVGANFPNVVVEHVGNSSSDILHCMRDSAANRQFCRVGWGQEFKKLARARILAPEAYAADLLIPEITKTPYGTITAAAAIRHLHEQLWRRYRIAPHLDFTLEWSENRQCWKDGVLKKSLKLMSGETEIGHVETGARNYTFTLTDPEGKRAWQPVSNLDQLQNRVQWKNPNNEMAIHTEFDFVDEDLKATFSPLILAPSCKIILKNVQIVLSRPAVDQALRQLEDQVNSLVAQLSLRSLLYWNTLKSRDGVRCALARLPSENVSAAARVGLEHAVLSTGALSGYDPTVDPIAFLEANRTDWLRACDATETTQSIERMMAVPQGLDPAIQRIIADYLRQKTELHELVEDAWMIALLLQLVSDDNKQLNWLIDTTITFNLTTRGQP